MASLSDFYGVTGISNALIVNCNLCDARGVQEDVLKVYDKVVVNCTVLLETPESKALLAKYPVVCNAGRTMALEGEVTMSTVNGRMTLGPSMPPPEKGTVLAVNGQLEVLPGGEEALKGYLMILVNGQVMCPESMNGLMSGVTVNGQIETYPDGCIRLGSTYQLDNTFALRAKTGRMYYARRLVALDLQADLTRLGGMDVTFRAKKVLVAQSLAEGFLPMVNEDAQVTVLPDGTAYVGEDARLTDGLLARYGGKLYVNGDLTVTREGEKALEKLQFLQVNGDVRVLKALEDKFHAVKAVYEGLQLCAGTLVEDRQSVTVDAALLENAPDGVSIVDCVNVAFDPEVSAELLREKLFSLRDCVNVTCTPAQRAVLQLMAEDVVNLGEKKEGGESVAALPGGAKVVNTVIYHL